jgi:hypothetical protein
MTEVLIISKSRKEGTEQLHIHLDIYRKLWNTSIFLIYFFFNILDFKPSIRITLPMLMAKVHLILLVACKWLPFSPQ